MKKYKVGEKIMYPPHGVGIIEAIEAVEYGEIKEKVLVIRLLENEMVVKVPIRKAEKVGVRKLAGEREVEEVLDIIASSQKAYQETKEKVSWTVKQRKFLDKVKTGNLKVVAEVYRDLMIISRDKELSYGERNILEMAENMLVFEIAEAKGISSEEARRMLRSFFEVPDTGIDVEEDDEAVD